MKGIDLLKQLQHYERECPSLLDRDLDATFGNDDSGNAERINIAELVPAGDERVNGVYADDAAELVLLVDEPTPASVKLSDFDTVDRLTYPQARDRLVEMLCDEDLDLDGLARLYSHVATNNPVVIVHEDEADNESFAFQNGEQLNT